MTTISVAKAFTLQLDSGEKLSFAVGQHEVDPAIADHWFTQAHLVGGSVERDEREREAIYRAHQAGNPPPRPPPPVPPSVPPITAAEAKELLGLFLKVQVPLIAWERVAQVLTELRLPGDYVAHVLARRDATMIYAVRQALRQLDKTVERITAEAEAFTVQDLPITESSQRPDGLHVLRAGAPGDLAAAIRVAEVQRHTRVVQGRDALAALLPVLDLRLPAAAGGYQWGTAWAAAAYAVWMVAEEVFTKLDLPTGRHEESPFIQFIVAAMESIGFSDLSEEALLKWRQRHADKFK